MKRNRFYLALFTRYVYIYYRYLRQLELMCFFFNRSCQILLLVMLKRVFSKKKPLLFFFLTYFLFRYIAEFEQLIDEYINQEVGVQKTSLGIRNQKCYAVKVSLLIYPACNLWQLIHYITYRPV